MHNPIYLMSLEYITRENPRLFQDKEFREHATQVLNMNEKIGNVGDKVYKKSGMARKNKAIKKHLK